MASAEVSFWAGALAWIAARFAGFGTSREAAIAAVVSAVAAYGLAARAGQREPFARGSFSTIRALLFAAALYRGAGALWGDGPATETWRWLVVLAVFAAAAFASTFALWRRPLVHALASLTLGALGLYASTRAAPAPRAALGAVGSALVLAALTHRHPAPEAPAAPERERSPREPVSALVWSASLVAATALLWLDRPFAAAVIAALTLEHARPAFVGRSPALAATLVLACCVAAPYAVTRAACRLTNNAPPDFSAAIWCR